MRGSSPQVRGPLILEDFTGQIGRLIPAGAGTTQEVRVFNEGNRAHPRRCGDHMVWASLAGCGMGSSPQVRGPPIPYRSVSQVGRLIPAGAGTTCALTHDPAGIAAHPRRCGDHPSSVHISLSRPGSSPQVRGPLTPLYETVAQGRLIPAGAGTTSMARGTGRPSRAHPRRCGDHPSGVRKIIIFGGSSPQVRGPPLNSLPAGLRWRLIPAGAGTTG